MQHGSDISIFRAPMDMESVGKIAKTGLGCIEQISYWVAKLVKSFEALYEITESLHDFRYEPIYVFSFEDALASFERCRLKAARDPAWNEFPTVDELLR